MAGILLPKRGLWQKPVPSARFNPNSPFARGLQALYLCNEQGGPTLNEASSQHPAASFVAGSGSQWDTKGFFGNALALSPSIGHYDCGNICDNLSNITVSCWFKAGSNATGKAMLGKFGTGGFSSGAGWSICYNGVTPGIICQASGGSNYRQINLTATPSSSTWWHFVATVSAYVPQKLYLNAVAQATSALSGGTVPTTTTNASTLCIGSDSQTADAWTGDVDVIGIWNRVLTLDEIQRLYLDPFCFMAPAGNLFSKGRITKPQVALAVSPKGIFSAEALGAAIFSLGVGPGGISSGESIGNDIVANTQILTPLGIPTQESEGASGVAENLLPLGIASAEASGATNVALNNAVNVFPASVTSAEGAGQPAITGAGINPGAISSSEAFGAESIAINLLPLGITSEQVIGAVKVALGVKKLISVPQRRFVKRWKPLLGTRINPNSSITQGLVLAAPFLEQGGNSTLDSVSNVVGTFDEPFSSIIPWVVTDTGLAPQSTSSSKVSFPAAQPRYTDLPLTGTGAMSVSFRIKFNSSVCSFGGTIMGKSDSTDGSAGNTAGWNVNADNNYSLVGGIDPSYVTSPINYIPNTNSGANVIKLEFECDQWNKQGGVYIPSTPDNKMHQVTICTAGGMVGGAAEIDDYTVYLDGQLIVRDPLHRSFITGAKYFYCASGNQTTSDAAYKLSVGGKPNGANTIQSPVDNVLVHNRVLTPEEALQLYVDPYCYLRRPRRVFTGLAGSTTQFVFPGGVNSAQAIGGDSILVQASQSVTPLGIMSAEAAGAALVATAQLLFPSGIPSQQEVGAINIFAPAVQFITPNGITSTENFGDLRTTIANIQHLFPGGIVSLEFVEDSNFSGFIVTSPPNRVIKPFPQIRLLS